MVVTKLCNPSTQSIKWLGKHICEQFVSNFPAMAMEYETWNKIILAVIMENRRKVTFPISTFMKKDTRQTKSFEMGYTLWNRNCTAGLKNFQL